MVTMDLDTEVIVFCGEEVLVSTLGQIERKEFRLCARCSKPFYVGYSQFCIAHPWISTIVGYSFTIPSKLPEMGTFRRWNKENFQINLCRAPTNDIYVVSPSFFTKHIIALHSIRSNRFGESSISEIEL